MQAGHCLNSRMFTDGIHQIHGAAAGQKKHMFDAEFSNEISNKIRNPIRFAHSDQSIQ